MKVRPLGCALLVCAASATMTAATAATPTPMHARALDDTKVSGTITKADLTANTFTVNAGEGKSVDLTVGKDTKFTVDGQPATKEEVLKVGANVSVKHKDNQAISVDAKTK